MELVDCPPTLSRTEYEMNHFVGWSLFRQLQRGGPYKLRYLQYCVGEYAVLTPKYLQYNIINI